jgi:hypothetical protein
MPRQLRIEYPGAIYHVMNRGDRRGPIASMAAAITGRVASRNQGLSPDSPPSPNAHLATGGIALLKWVSPDLDTNPAGG